MSEKPFVRCIKVTAATVSAAIEVSNPIAQQPGAVTMYCSTNLQISPIIPRPAICTLPLISPGPQLAALLHPMICPVDGQKT
jgi:hypothetical protein